MRGTPRLARALAAAHAGSSAQGAQAGRAVVLVRVAALAGGRQRELEGRREQPGDLLVRRRQADALELPGVTQNAHGVAQPAEVGSVEGSASFREGRKVAQASAILLRGKEGENKTQRTSSRR